MWGRMQQIFSTGLFHLHAYQIDSICKKHKNRAAFSYSFYFFFHVETPTVRGDDFDYPLEKHELRKNYSMDFDEILYAYF